jgi:hypothetical protein
MKQKTVILLVIFVSLALLLGAAGGAAVSLAIGQTTLAEPSGSAFTYQGRLSDSDSPADGAYDFEFRLYTTADGEGQVGPTVGHNEVAVSDGLFTVLLDFGAGVFDGEARYLEIRVRPAGEGGFTILDPRQPLTAAPYALYSHTAPWDGLIDVPAGFADGVDDDTLATLSCSNGQVTKWDGNDWGCTADNDTTYTAGAGLFLSGTEFSAQGSPYANVLVVAQNGGDFSSVQAALDNITDATADNPYLVYVAPGVYNEQVTMKPYVDIEGAGEGRTIIHYTGSDTSPFADDSAATVIGADNAALRHLTVESDGTGKGHAVGILNNGASPDLLYVTTVALDAATNTSLWNNAASPSLNHVTATASGGNNSRGVFNNSGSSPMMNNVVTTAVDGNNTNRGVHNDAGSYPTMNNVTAIAAGGSSSAGVRNVNSSPAMTNVMATASAGSNTNYGVYNTNSASPVMTNITASALGGGNSYGVYNYGSGTSATIRNSVLEGDTYSVYNANASTAKVANSQLIGSVLSTGMTCFNNYDENLDPPFNCP